MEDKNFSPEQSLQIIQAMIEKAKNQFSENGHLYLLWGWTVFVCGISQFILMKFVQTDKHYYVWFACWLVAIYQFFYLRNQQKQQRVRTYADKMIGFVWISFIVLMLLVGISIGKVGGDEYYKLFAPIFLAMYGVPTFLSGIFLKFKPLVLGGTGCWVLSVLAHFISFEYQLLLLPLAMVIAWIIPGYALRKQYRQSH